MEPEETPQAPALPPPPPAPVVNDAQVQAQVQAYVGQLQAQYEAQQKHAFEQAQAQFQKQLAEMQARQQIESYAQDVTTPTLSRQHTLPFQASEISTFLMGLSTEQRKGAQGMFDKILSAGLVNFEELGSAAPGEEQRDAKARWDEAVNAKVQTGMSKSAAISAVMKEQPALVAEYRQKGGR